MDDRVEVGQTCMDKMALEMPALVDEMDDAVASAYGAMPERLYLIGADGRIAYKGGMGPMFFRPDDESKPILGQNLCRTSRGKMLGVDFNKDFTWVGGTVALW